MSRNLNSLTRFHTGPITVRDIIRGLRRHVNVMQCDIYGHLTTESDIAILSVPIVQKPTPLQVKVFPW